MIVPLRAVEVWRDRFPLISDLEAKMQKLAAVIRSRGIQHVGWNDPGPWMAGCLADDNKRAADQERITNAKVARATSYTGSGRRTFER